MRVKLVAGLSYTAILLSSIGANAAADTPAVLDNGAAPGSAVVAGGQSSADACAAVAAAKFAQWNEKRFMIRETETFADGRKKTVEAIFTPDSGYARVNNGPWSSMNLVRRQRAAPSAAYLLKRMGLEECSLGGADANAKQPTSVYSYEYLPDSHARQVTGKMWIDNSTQLPVEQELAQAEASQANVPISVEASYTYGDAVTVPAAAQRSDERRRWIEQQIFLNRTASASGAGPAGDNPRGARHH